MPGIPYSNTIFDDYITNHHFFFWFDPPFVTVPFCAGWTEEQWLMKAQELLKTYGIDTYGSPAVKLWGRLGSFENIGHSS